MADLGAIGVQPTYSETGKLDPATRQAGWPPAVRLTVTALVPAFVLTPGLLDITTRLAGIAGGSGSPGGGAPPATGGTRGHGHAG